MITQAQSTRRIRSDPDIMGGKPCIVGTRVTVETIVRRFAEGYTVPEILADYPNIAQDDIIAAMDFAAERSATPADALG